MQVKKRNGNIVEFDREKVYRALWSAFTDVYQDADKEDKISNTVDRAIVLLRAAPRDIYEISEIQSVVEKALVDVEEYSVAKAYTDYRLEHDIQRKKQTSVEYQVNRFFEKDDDVVNENANKDSELYSTQRDLIAGAVSKAVGLKKLPQDVADAHVKGILHWHDLDYSPSTSEHNCGLIDLKDMLANGFRLGNADVEPPKSLSTAVAVASQVLASIGGSQFGGMSYDRLDEVLAPYAEMSYNKYLEKAKEYHIVDPVNYAEKETIKEIKDCCQSLEYEVNTLFSSQGQTPFCTFGFGLGKNWFAREIQKGILNQRIAGLGKHGKTAIFPKLLFTIKPGLNMKPEDPNYDIKRLALKSVVKRMSPEILNYDNVVDITGSFKASMGCRSFLNGLTKEDLDAMGEKEDFSSGRLNLGVVSINLPRVALDAHGDKEKFWSLLDERLELVKEALLFRIETVKQALPKYNPTGFMYGGYGRLDADGDVDKLFRNNRASVSLGYVGLYEMAAVFYGDWQHDHGYDQEARDFAYDVLKHMNITAREWKKTYGYAFSCYGTPGEALNSSFEERDHKLYPNVPHVTDHDFYTNSFHYFVERKPTPFEKMEFEAPFQHLSTGGFISYIEAPIMNDNLDAVEAIWDYSYEVGIGYMEINTPIDHCLECDFRGEYIGDEKGYHCPQCGNDNPETSDVTRRTCFTEGHLLETDNGYKDIRDIQVGDNVRTAEGNFKPVIDTMNHLSDELLTISFSGLEDMTSTKDHPYFAKLDRNAKYGLHRADELKVGSYVGIKINDKSIPVHYKNLPTDSQDFWWLVGRIIGDGFISKDRGKNRVYLTVGKQDSIGIRNINSVIESLDLGFTSLQDNGTALRTNTYNKELGEFLLPIGHRAENKQIPAEWLDLPKDLAESLLDGYLSADGCIAQNKQMCNSVSRELLYGIGQLVLKTKGKTYCIYQNRQGGQMEIEDRIVNTLSRYDLKYTLGTPRFNFIENGYAFIKITGIKEESKPAVVYNITVDEEHTYSVNNVGVHNCGYLGNPMKRPMKKGRQKEIIHRVKHISGSLGQLSNGEELWSDDADEKKVR